MLVASTAAAVEFAGFLLYGFSKIRRPSRRELNPVVWSIWTVEALLVALSYQELSAGALTALVFWVQFICTGALAVVAFTCGRKSLEHRCMLLCFGMVAVWCILRLLGLTVLSGVWILSIDIIGSFVFLREVWGRPFLEDLRVWCIFFFADGLNVCAVQNWTVNEAAFLIIEVSVCAAVIAIYLNAWELEPELPAEEHPHVMIPDAVALDYDPFVALPALVHRTRRPARANREWMHRILQANSWP